MIRPPTVEDAEAIGAVHVAAWRAAYAGLMPDDYLAGLSAEDRAAMWREVLPGPPRPRSSRLVVTDDDGAVQGFAVCGPAEGDPDATGGQLYAINVHPDAWGRGLGQALLAAVHEALRGAGFTDAVLWVHPGNDRARRFYEAAGWTCEGTTRDEDVLGVTVPVIRFVVDLTTA